MIPLRLYAYLAAFALFVVGCVAISTVYGHFKDRLREEGRQEIRLQVAVRDKDAAIALAMAVQEATSAVRAEEDRKHASILKTSETGQKRLQEAQNENRKLATDLAAASVVFRDPGASSCAAPGPANSPGTAPGPAPVGNGTPPGRLSEQASSFLLRLAGDADATAIALGACQDIVRQDRQ